MVVQVDDFDALPHVIVRRPVFFVVVAPILCPSGALLAWEVFIVVASLLHIRVQFELDSFRQVLPGQ